MDFLEDQYTCLICTYFPRPYLPIVLCSNMHMICGLCHIQCAEPKQKECSFCTQIYKEYPPIAGFHSVYEYIKDKTEYKCFNVYYGCPTAKRFKEDTILEHDRACPFGLFKCQRVLDEDETCSYMIPWKDLFSSDFNHKDHILPVFKQPTAVGWECRVSIGDIFDDMQQIIVVSPGLPQFALCKGESKLNIDPLFRVALEIKKNSSAAAIGLVWHCHPHLSPVDISDLKFQVSVMVTTRFGPLILTSDIVKPCFVGRINKDTLRLSNDHFIRSWSLIRVVNPRQFTVMVVQIV